MILARNCRQKSSLFQPLLRVPITSTNHNRAAAAIGGSISCWHRYLSSDTPEKCYNIAIVGSGPSGCYTAKYLLSSFDKMRAKNNNAATCKIDMLERLPTPYGLVRYGVAPDHPEVKNVENDFAALFENNSENKRMTFWGNVEVGNDTDGVSVEELRLLYDVVVLAYGCESDRKLGLAGEDQLSGILSAREFVAWYNGHPHFEHIGAQVEQALGEGGEVVVIGQGNVALDCARILGKGQQGLYDTDIASRALSVIGDGVPVVTVVGRRGHVQGAFTIKELRELTKLEEEGYGTRFVVDQGELDLGATSSSQEELAQKGGRPKVRIDKLLRDAAAKTSEKNDSALKEIRLRFLLSPTSFEPLESDASSVGAVLCERTRLDGEPGKQVAVGTGQEERIPAKLVLVSIGYKGVPLSGLEPWFDDRRGVVTNQGGKVDDAKDSLGGLYVSGWLKRGPSGIIGTNIMDAKDTVVNIVNDLLRSGDSEDAVDAVDKGNASTRLDSLLKERKVPVVAWSNFELIDKEETSAARRRSDNQPREKITDLQDLLEAAKVISR